MTFIPNSCRKQWDKVTAQWLWVQYKFWFLAGMPASGSFMCSEGCRAHLCDEAHQVMQANTSVRAVDRHTASLLGSGFVVHMVGLWSLLGSGFVVHTVGLWSLGVGFPKVAPCARQLFCTISSTFGNTVSYSLHDWNFIWGGAVYNLRLPTWGAF